MFHTLAIHFQSLDFLGARYYDSVNDGYDGNNNATDSLCVPLSLARVAETPWAW
ncbi:MAG: hypothetical protein ACPIOQ_22065 [Promethearchaeia archaeon]